MGARGARGAAVAAILLAGCAGHRIVDGVYHSPRGYRVALPGDGWRVIEGLAELELRHDGDGAGMLANAVCEPAVVGRSLAVLRRHLLVGLVDREVVEGDEVAVNGRAATHAVVRGRRRDSEARVSVEAYVVKDARCVYDFLLVTPGAEFPSHRGDFRRLVDSFATE